MRKFIYEYQYPFSYDIEEDVDDLTKRWEEVIAAIKKVEMKQEIISPMDLKFCSLLNSIYYDFGDKSNNFKINETNKKIRYLNDKISKLCISETFFNKIKHLDFEFVADMYNKKLYLNFENIKDLSKFKILQY